MRGGWIPIFLMMALFSWLAGCAGDPDPPKSATVAPDAADAIGFDGGEPVEPEPPVLPESDEQLPEDSVGIAGAEKTDDTALADIDDASEATEALRSPAAGTNPLLDDVRPLPGYESDAPEETLADETPGVDEGEPVESATPEPRKSPEPDEQSPEDSVGVAAAEKTDDTALAESDDASEATETVRTPTPGTNPLLDDARPLPGYESDVPEKEALANEVAAHPMDDEAAGVPEAPILPVTDRAAEPERHLSGPGEISIVLEGRDWLFRSDLSEPGAWRFVDRIREGDSTTFRFKFLGLGNWKLVFERRDLASGEAERTARTVRVDEEGEPVADMEVIDEASVSRPSMEPQPVLDPDRKEEILAVLEIEADKNDASGVRARESLMSLAAETDSVGILSTWLPRYLEDEIDAKVLAKVFDAFEAQTGYREESRRLLTALESMDHGERLPEWLYKLALALEEPGEGRDLDRARLLHARVVEGWPLSRWRDLAEMRLQRLERHYFRIQ